jgi:CubicO group peptidase (beta-lactamase class C family)
MNLYLLVLEAGTIKDAFSQTMDLVGFDQGLLAGGGETTLGDWQAYSQNDAAGLSYGLAGQIVGDNVYVFMVRTNKPGLDPASPAVAKVLTSVVITGKVETKIESFADVEAMVQKKVDSLAGSISIAVVHNDEIVYTYAYGQANPIEGIPADTQTIYAIGSMTKPFTAAALMQLVEQGRVDLDAWPGEYIPEFPESWNVTVRQLLDHSACLENSQRLTNGLIVTPGESFAPLDELFTAYVRDYPNLVCEPGKVSNYSNPHFLALARIIEEVSGEPYDTYVIDHILTPLAMDSSSFELVEPNERYAKEQYLTTLVDGLVAEVTEYRGPGQESLVLQTGVRYSTLDDYRVLPPWGGLRSTPSDVAHFLSMFLNGGRYGDVRILKPETVAAMQEMQTSTDGSDLGFGLSRVWKDDREFIYHNGTLRVKP